MEERGWAVHDTSDGTADDRRRQVSSHGGRSQAWRRSAWRWAGKVGGGVGVGVGMLRSSTCLAMEVDRIGVTQLICISFWTNDMDKGAVVREGDCSSLSFILTHL